MAQHAILSPSSSVRWLNCPGSVARTTGIDDEGSEAAAEGTDAHELAALCLTVGADAAEFLGKVLPLGHVVDEWMAAAVQQYLDYVRSLPGEHSVEVALPLTPLTDEPDAFGTADHLAEEFAAVYVTDFKYGYCEVAVEGNTQLLTYAAAACVQRDRFPLHVVLTIVQPRAFDTPQTWSISGQELADWAAGVLVPGAERTRNASAPLVAGEKQCQWCRGKANCPALADYALAPLDRDLVSLPTELAPPAPAKMAAAHLVDVVNKAKLIKSWLEAVDAEVTRRLLEGVPVLDWKLVRGRKGNKAWAVDEATVAGVLRNNYGLVDETIFRHELHTPATIFGLPAVKESPDLLKTLITQKDGALCAAPATDKRPGVLTQDQIAAQFSVTTE